MNLTDQLSILTANEPQLRLLIDMIQEFIVVKDGHGRWLITNKRVLEAYGLQGCEYRGKTDLELAVFSPQFKKEFDYNRKTDEMAWEKGSALQVEKSFYGPDGVLNTWEVVKTPVFTEKGGRHHLVIVSRNITERKKAEAALQASEAKYRLIAEHIKDIIITVEKDGACRYLSPSFDQVLGRSGNAFLGRHFSELLHQKDAASVRNTFQKTIKSKRAENKLEFRCYDVWGRCIWFEANCSFVYKENNEVDYIMITARNIMERKKYEYRLKTMAYHDYLTSIPNRRFFMKQLPKEMAKADRTEKLLALVYLDLDHFKKINDEMGHEAGDELLMQFVQRVQSSLSLTDTMARIGGDEFVIMLPGLQVPEEANRVAERICDSLKEPWNIGGQALHTTSSIGVALYPQDGTTVQELILNADVALYKAKRKGRNQVQLHQPEGEYKGL